MSFESARKIVDTATAVEERRALAYDYVENGLNPSENLVAQTVAQDILQADRPLSNTVIIIPVAAHQEALQIPIALDQYARQRGGQPFTLVLGLNCPPSESKSEAVAATLEAITRGQEHYPDLDVRTTFVTYEQPVMGEIRRDLWNGVAMAAKVSGSFDQGREVIGINHDIDLMALTPDAIAKVQKHYFDIERQAKGPSILPITHIQAVHANSPQHPNSSRAIAWFDYGVRQRNWYYEASLNIPMSAYMHKGGFDADDKTREAVHLALLYRQPGLVKGAHMQISPRSYLNQLGVHGYRSDFEDFYETDNHRSRQNVQDISESRMMEIIRESLPGYAQGVIKSAAMKALADVRRLQAAGSVFDKDTAESLFDAEVLKRVGRLQATGGRILSKVIEADHLIADFTQYLDSGAVTEIVKIHKAALR